MTLRQPEANTATRLITIASVVGSSAFAAGVSAHLAGTPVHDLGDRKLQWAYERGRQFAAYCAYRHVRVPTLTRRGRATMAAMQLYKDGRQDGSIT